MGYIVYFDIAAICVMIIIFLSYGFRKRVMDRQGKFLILMLVSNFVSAITDFLFVWISGHEIWGAKWLLYGVNYLYFVAHIITVAAFFFYCLCLVGQYNKIQRWKRYLWMTPVALSVILFGIQLRIDIIFTIDNHLQYIRMPGIIVIYICYFFYIVAGLVCLIRYKNQVGKEVRIYCDVFAVICIVTFLIQLFNTDIMIETFGVAICILLFSMVLERPEELVIPELGIFNQRALLKTLNNKFQTGERFSCIILKVHNLKVLRETMGVEVVSQLVKQVAEYLDETYDHTKVYQFTQSVFVLLMDKKVSVTEAERMMECISNRFDETWDEDDIVTRLRIHQSYMRCPKDAANMDILMNYLQYMRNSSAENQNTILNAGDMNIEERNRELRIRKILEDSVENQGFEVFYQPIYSTTEERIISAEALIRLKDQSMGYISPEEFIPIAEQSGAILKIGEFVFESVCRFLNEENLKQYGIQFIEINLSVVQCMQNNLVERLIDIMRRYQIEPEQINLEITETAAIHSTEVLEANIHKLYEQGIHFSLDDYGSGYSNTDYLFHFPFKMVKIDKMILWEAFKNEKAMIALKNTIQMIKELGLEVVVEGVETIENVNYLKEQNCDFLQGYYYSKPVPRQRFLALVQQMNS